MLDFEYDGGKIRATRDCDHIQQVDRFEAAIFRAATWRRVLLDVSANLFASKATQTYNLCHLLLHSSLNMVRSTVVVRASDALPLAASVDDEQVRYLARGSYHCQLIGGDYLDRTITCRTQTTIQAHFPTYLIQL